jgi:copper chaperone NosL
MTISDPRFTAELVTRSGRVLSFDDPACLALFLQEGTVPPAQVHSLWVADFLHPDRWLDARRATYLRRADLATPMASGLAAFASRIEADSVREASGGVLLDWDEVSRVPVPHPSGAGGHPPPPSGPGA